jgi:glycosyltransferase involved in cell wall biosynthesis
MNRPGERATFHSRRDNTRRWRHTVGIHLSTQTQPTDKAPLSAIVTSFNEEKNIGDCLASLQFAAEIILVDSFSQDRTREIARPLTTRILEHEYKYPSAQKNWAIPQASHEWVLILDADERVTPELEAEIREILRRPEFDGYWIRRRNIFWGREIRHGTWRKDKVLRLFRRDWGRYQDKHVHEEIVAKSATGWCRQRLLHYSYATLDDFMRKAARYGGWGALDARARGTRPSAWRILAHSLAHFLKSYVLKLGFLDRTPGLVIAFMEAYHGFFKYARLYELGLNTEPAPEEAGRQPPP